MPKQNSDNSIVADPPNHNQLSPPSYGRPTALHDAPLGLRRSTIRRLQHHGELQHRTADPSSDPDVSKFTDLEPMLLLREALEHHKVCSRSGHDVLVDGSDRNRSYICLEGSN